MRDGYSMVSVRSPFTGFNKTLRETDRFSALYSSNLMARIKDLVTITGPDLLVLSWIFLELERNVFVL